VRGNVYDTPQNKDSNQDQYGVLSEWADTFGFRVANGMFEKNVRWTVHDIEVY
jgi:hypothetical protein